MTELYNRYLPQAEAPASIVPLAQNKKHPLPFLTADANTISQLLSGIDENDLLIVLAVAAFLLADGELVHTDLLILVALLFVLGL